MPVIRNTYTLLFLFLITMLLQAQTRQFEHLDRGGIAIKYTVGVYVGWRLLGSEKYSSFNLYRNGTLINESPITGSTNYLDLNGKASDTYLVKAVNNGIESEEGYEMRVWDNPYLKIPVQCPPDGVSPEGSINGSTYTYQNPALGCSEVSIADLDGDGEYEVILKWEPSNWRDNSQSGYTGNTYFDAYKLDGTLLWRIDLGKNIRSGAHYTPFLVADFDGDGIQNIPWPEQVLAASPQVNASKDISYWIQGQTVNIQTKDEIIHVALYTAHGQLIHQQNGNHQTQCKIVLPEKEDVFIVRIITNQTIRSFKIMRNSI